ncbi:ABC transporter permease [Tersicoccus sp. MR15.9]|uniref:ABC transporter permease n=1 Tax=Tersicoccus mangrovi TaxID=3121635 RepID=UPI002FE585DC
MTATTSSAPSLDLHRSVPRFGGFNRTYLAIEVKRRLSNWQSVFFTVGLPLVMFLTIGLPLRDTALGSTPVAAGGVSAAAYLMVSMAVYGSMFASASAGAAVASERAMGWSRQLRLTPLHPVANVVTKILSGLVMSLITIVAVYGAGAVAGIGLQPGAWLLSAVAVWLTSLVFTALGLLVGYLVPRDNALQFVGPVLAFMSIFGGLFYPLPDDGVMAVVGRLMPVYGVGDLSRAPLTGATVDAWGAVNLVVWLVVLVAGAALAFRRDTRRV